ncbi:MAG: hypothetical protein PF961_04525 [Planctomycetota bacterium]|jgi:hypothetical protein|nr:hypothetical protein [Planctomycetota bacterium]
MPRLLTIAIAMFLPAVLGAAVVQAGGEALEGTVVAKGATLQVGKSSVAWKDLRWFHAGERARAPLAPYAVVTSAGERYPGQILGYDGQQLRFAADPGTELELAADDLAALLLQPQRAIATPESLPALVRRDASAVSGNLKRLMRSGVVVSSQLGDFSVDDGDAVAYLWREPANGVGSHTLVLHGGARLRADWTLADGKLSCTHPRFGALTVPMNAVHSLRRHQGVQWLSASAQVVRHQGLLAEVPVPRAIDPTDPAAGLVLHSDSMLTWTLDKGRVAMLVEARRGTVGLVAAIDKRSVAKLVVPEGERRLWQFDVPGKKRVLIALKGSGVVPAEAALHEPHAVGR